MANENQTPPAPEAPMDRPVSPSNASQADIEGTIAASLDQNPQLHLDIDDLLTATGKKDEIGPTGEPDQDPGAATRAQFEFSAPHRGTGTPEPVQAIDPALAQGIENAGQAVAGGVKSAISGVGRAAKSFGGAVKGLWSDIASRVQYTPGSVKAYTPGEPVPQEKVQAIDPQLASAIEAAPGKAAEVASKSFNAVGVQAPVRLGNDLLRTGVQTVEWLHRMGAPIRKLRTAEFDAEQKYLLQPIRNRVFGTDYTPAQLQQLRSEQSYYYDPEAESKFMDWYKQPLDEQQVEVGGVRLYPTEEELNQKVGAEPEGIYGLMMGVSKTMLAMAVVGEGLKLAADAPLVGSPLARGLSLLNKSGMANNLTKGAIVDNLFTNVHAARLSNYIQNSPLRNPITEYLAASPDDTWAKAHLKATLEGMMTGAMVEYLFKGIDSAFGREEGEAAQVADAAPAADGGDPSLPENKVKVPKRGPTVYATRQMLPQQPPPGADPGSPEAVHAEHMQAGEVGLGPVGEDDVVEAVATQDGKFVVRPIAKPRKLLGPDLHAVVNTREASAPLIEGKELVFDNPEDAFAMSQEINIGAKHELITPEKILPGQIQEIMARVQDYEQNGDLRGAKEIVERYGLHPSYTGSPDETFAVLKGLVDAFPESSVVTRGRLNLKGLDGLSAEEAQKLGHQSWDEVAKRGQDLVDGLSGSDVAALAQRLQIQQEKMPAYVDALRVHLFGQLEYARKLYNLTELYPDVPWAQARLQSVLTSAYDIHTHLTGITSSTARTLNQTKRMVGPEAAKAVDSAMEGAQSAAAKGGLASLPESSPHRAPAVGGLYDGLSRNEIKSLNRWLFLGGDQADPLTAFKLMRTVEPLQIANKIPDPELKRNVLDALFTIRTEAMLSGPKTQVTNTLNNVLVGMSRPLETWWAGVISGNQGLRTEGMAMYAGLWKNFGESWRATKLAFADGAPILDPGHSTIDAAGAHSQDFSGLGPWNNTSWLSKYGRLPSRLLLAEDEWAKQMNYRAKVQALTMRQAEEQGVSDPAEIARRLDANMQLSFKDGRATNPLGLEYTRNATFTDDAGPVAQWLSEGSKKIPAVRLIMPFIRTPANIFNYAWERTPALNLLMGKYRADLAAGGERAALAQAKTQFGLALWGTGAMLALSGKLTGRGPMERDLRSEWATNNRPYSLNVGDLHFDMRRAEPIFTPFTVIADLVGASGEIPDQDLANYAFALAASVSSNVTNKTYMQGLSQTLDAVASDDPHKVQRLWDGLWASFYPNVIRQANPDPYLHETQGLWDELAARTPGWSSTMEARRNILGDKVLLAPGAGYGQRALNPFMVSPSKVRDPEMEMLTKLGKGFSMPAEKILGGAIDLTDRDLYGLGKDGNQSPYDRMMELIQKGGYGQPPLRVALRKMMARKDFQALSNNDLQGHPGGGQWMEAAKLVNKYQEWALRSVLTESMQAGKTQAPGWRLARDYENIARSQRASLFLGHDAAQQLLKTLNDEDAHRQAVKSLTSADASNSNKGSGGVVTPSMWQ